MRAKVGLGIVAVTLVAFGLVAGSGLLAPPAAEAQSRPDAAPAGSLVIRFSTSVSPTFEGGAVGPPVPLTVEIRGDGASIRDIPAAAWRKQLPDQVKAALEEALEQALYAPPPADRRLDQILERLDGIERRLKQLEREKPSAKLSF